MPAHQRFIHPLRSQTPQQTALPCSIRSRLPQENPVKRKNRAEMLERELEMTTSKKMTFEKPKSEKWYNDARKQTFATLPTFIAKVESAYPGYEHLKNPNEYKSNEEYLKVSNVLYRNGIFAAILISYAAFSAATTRYSFSCNQAGVARNCLYKAIFDENTPYEEL